MFYKLSNLPRIPLLIFTLAFIVFAYLSFRSIIYVPFYDFDEAHRAENAKRMREYKSYFIPLTGSSQDRVEHLKTPLRENKDFYLYYHLERPPLVYILMILSTTIFGQEEWAYRLPSFLLGVSIFFVFLIFAKKEGYNLFALSLGLLTLFASGDLWLSSQYAQMDTGIALFLFLSLLSLVYYVSSKKPLLIFLSGIFFGLAALSKLQPVVIFIFPVLYLYVSRKIKLSDLVKLTCGFLFIFLPWVIYLIIKFGIKDVVNIMPGFAITSASIINIHQEAPFFWYIRWWWESFRPGWTIFIALLFYDLILGNLNWQKKALLSYILGGLLAFSIPINKIWWYVLPLIPAICYYIFLSSKDYLEKARESRNRLRNLSFAVVLASLPIFLRVSTTQALIYGLVISIITILVLQEKLVLKTYLGLGEKRVFYISLLLSLLLFLPQFPKIIPYHWNTKPVALYYKSLPNPKCLWLGDMPGEAALFYSNAGEIPILNKDTQIFRNCKNNYLITPQRYKEGDKEGELVTRRGNMRLYKL